MGDVVPVLPDGQINMSQAYEFSAQLIPQRETLLGQIVGLKGGFTNRSIWDKFNVDAPVMGPIYSRTVHEITQTSNCQADQFLEPKIEPELAFRLKAIPEQGMSALDLLGCTDALAHGFEIVQSPYPNWQFSAAQAVSVGALHGALYLGPWYRTPNAPHTLRALATQLEKFAVRLYCTQGSGQRELVEQALATNVMGNPVNTLAYIAQESLKYDFRRKLSVGDIVLTGTITNAYSIEPGQIWSTDVLNLSWPNDWLAIEKMAGISLQVI